MDESRAERARAQTHVQIGGYRCTRLDRRGLCTSAGGGLMKLIGIVLIVVGVLALAFGGFSFTTRERVADLGPLKVDADKQHSFPIAPIAGVAALVGGIVMVVAGSRTRV